MSNETRSINIDSYSGHAYFTDDLFEKVAGMESYDIGGMMSSGSPQNVNDILKRYSGETLRVLCALKENYTKNVTPRASRLSKEEVKIETETNINENFHRAAFEHATNERKFAALPVELKNVLMPLRTAYVNAANKESSFAANGTEIKADQFANKFVKDRARIAMEEIIFQAFTKVYDLQRDSYITNDGSVMFGNESAPTYAQTTILYPVFESYTQYANAAGTIYNKLVKTKLLLNDSVSIPIHTQYVEYVYRDPTTGLEIGQPIKREDLFAEVDPTQDFPYAYQELVRVLTLVPAEYGLPIDLHKTALTTGGVPFLLPLEAVRPDIALINLKINGVDMNQIYDYEAGRVLSDFLSEIDYKGKICTIHYDPDRTKFINIGVRFDHVNSVIMFFFNASPAAGSVTVDEVQFEFKLLDINFIHRPSMEVRIQQQRTFINSGYPIKEQININADQLAWIDAREKGSYLNKTINAVTEHVAHHKERIFFNGFYGLLAQIRALTQTVTPNSSASRDILYTRQLTDLRLLDTVNKVEFLGLSLAPVFDIMSTQLASRANSSKISQINFATSALSLVVIKPALKAIIGDVNEDTNGKFLGVTPEERTYVVTAGSDVVGSTQSIIVGSDKVNFRPNALNALGDVIPVQEVRYDYFGIPYFADPNLETIIFVETPTKITNSDGYRSARNPFIPSMSMETSCKMQTLRQAGAELTVTGYHLDAGRPW